MHHLHHKVPSQPRYLLHPSHPVLHDPGKGRAVRGVAELGAPRNGDDVAGGVHHFAREMPESGTGTATHSSRGPGAKITFSYAPFYGARHDRSAIPGG